MYIQRVVGSSPNRQTHHSHSFIIFIQYTSAGVKCNSTWFENYSKNAASQSKYSFNNIICVQFWFALLSIHVLVRFRHVILHVHSIYRNHAKNTLKNRSVKNNSYNVVFPVLYIVCFESLFFVQSVDLMLTNEIRCLFITKRDL